MSGRYWSRRQAKRSSHSAAAPDNNGGALARTPVKRIRFPGLRAEANVRSRNRKHQVHQHTAIERQLLHRLWLHHLTDTRISRPQNIRRGVDLHAFLNGTDLERDFNRQLLNNLESQRLHHRRKTGGVSREFIVAWQKNSSKQKAL